MDDGTKKDLIAKRDQVSAKLRQAEADVYFFQGQLSLVDELLEKTDTALTPEKGSDE